ncbi:SulP family sulfate permease [Frondihabitans sp. PhB188]|uniref:SulP family inorganic anion transporter n=1 Tax=Frondihabitans sp. PhB188 TaxID=2485200 RepID=UPI000F4A3754|nr:SulP family inorganic anion transporter [Frondihabitans sp. PhB188]ROQ39476.1 SulP family sulfate permease [Frondihabitans sp. PhB188]
MTTTASVPVPVHTSPSVLSALKNPRLLTREALAGLVVALALIPEAISFSIIAGVDPRVGLFSAFVMAVVISIVGGRAAMISGATGAIALVVAPVMNHHGLDYLIATVILGGVFQLVLGGVGAAKLMRFVPRSVMVGFVNALAILIFTAQLPNIIGVSWIVWPMTAAGIAVIVLLPRLTKAIPAPLVAIVLVTVVTVLGSIAIPRVGDEGKLPDSLPTLFVPHVPLTFETLTIIAPYAFAMALVGLLESLMTAKLVDEVTDTGSRKTREALGQGIANICSGFLGGMGGCAMIGQTMINVKASGARTRISTFLAGVFLLVLVVGLGDVVAVIPMAALVAVMVMVSVGTFDWHSVKPSTLRRMPVGETIVMVLTVVVVVATDNLAIGVIVGVIAAMVVFAKRVSRFASVTRSIETHADGTRRAIYTVDGELFFASSNDLTTQFDYDGDPDGIVIDMARSHVWDASTVAALDAIETKYRAHAKTVEIRGMNDASRAFHGRLAGNLGAGH